MKRDMDLVRELLFPCGNIQGLPLLGVMETTNGDAAERRED